MYHELRKAGTSGALDLKFAWQTRGRRVANVKIRSLEHDPEKHALGLDPTGVKRFSEKIVRNQESGARGRIHPNLNALQLFAKAIRSAGRELGYPCHRPSNSF